MPTMRTLAGRDRGTFIAYVLVHIIGVCSLSQSCRQSGSHDLSGRVPNCPSGSEWSIGYIVDNPFPETEGGARKEGGREKERRNGGEYQRRKEGKQRIQATELYTQLFNGKTPVSHPLHL